MIVLAQAASPSEVRRTVADVLGQADYRVEGGPSLLDRVIGWVLEQLGRLLLRVAPEGGSGSTIAALLLVLALVALLVWVGWWLRRLRRSATVDVVAEGPVGRAPRSWADEAARHEQAGDLRQALRCRYRETVARLAAEGLVEEVPGRTTGEYARAVDAAVPAAAEPFGVLTRAFEDAWYGGGGVDRDALARARQAQDEVARAAGLRARRERSDPAAAAATGGAP